MTDICYVDGPLIIGAGLAGLFTALKLAPQPCTVLSPEPLGNGASSAWAQGGLAAAIGAGDTAAAHAADTIAAGAGLVDEAVAQFVTAEASDRVIDLLSYGAPFDRDAQGVLLQSREAAHSANRVIRVSGDRAGFAIMQALIATVRQTPCITILEGVRVERLAMQDGVCCGAYGRGPDKTLTCFVASATLLATGGIGGLYAVSTNPIGVRGQGLGMAARAGALIADPEFVQFHPTGIAIDRTPCPLATEALRGHGATIIDETGRRFILDDHPDGELAPRDIVARAIHRKIQNGGKAFLDTRKVLGAALLTEFPTVASYCKDAGLDPVTDPIPVRPAQHYHMGGIWTDKMGRSSLSGLWACGEVASSGLHGANRLASNSLLEAVVFGARIAQDWSDKIFSTPPSPSLLRDTGLGAAPPDAVKQVQDVMDQQAGVERTARGLEMGLRALKNIEAEIPGDALKNITVAASLILVAGLQRQESRGGHYRADFPQENPQLAQRSQLHWAKAESMRASV